MYRLKPYKITVNAIYNSTKLRDVPSFLYLLFNANSIADRC